MSGGVDSSVSAALLRQQGYDCTGMFMVTNDHAQKTKQDASEVCQQLGIKLFVLDIRKDFECIIRYFCDEYKAGRTPNPCVFCNRHIKFGKLWDFAKDNGADYIATGHYASIITKDGQDGIYEAANISKDQSYVLSMIDRKVPGHLLLPMADNTKERTREMAKQLGLHIHNKSDSQEICFIPDNNHAAMLQKWCPGIAAEGKVIDSDSNVLGSHDGVFKYTIGQRRGLKIAMGQPVYVTNIDAKNNTVTIGPREQLLSKGLIASKVNWLVDDAGISFRAKVKIRYNHRGAMAEVKVAGDNVEVEFDEPVSAVTPGQTAVFYRNESDRWRLLGGAWIDGKME